MGRLLQMNVDTLVISAAVLAVGVAVGIYVIGKVRGESAQHELGPSELMSKFRELHSRGDLSDEEFRTIKTNLAAELQEELKGNDETG